MSFLNIGTQSDQPPQANQSGSRLPPLPTGSGSTRYIPSLNRGLTHEVNLHYAPQERRREVLRELEDEQSNC
jgi:hypothetical protein